MRINDRARWIGVLLAAAIAAVVVAGCGGSSSGAGLAQINSTSGSAAHTNTRQHATRASKPKATPSALAFSRCMRAHGVADFPDPRSSGEIPIKSAGGMTRAPSGGFTANPNSPGYQTASRDCRSLADATPVSQAQTNKITADQLKFAACMRTHGVPNYPDPTNSGEVGNNGAISGVNPSSPAVQGAEKTCRRFLTPPTVRPNAP
jgi:hypothetical protein